MLNPPKHLADISKINIDRTTDTSFIADIVCICGNLEFCLMHSGGILEQNGGIYPVTAEIDGIFFMILSVKCSNCGKSHLIFDRDYHGWDGFVCAHENKYRQNPRPELVLWSCVKCNSSYHKLTVCVSMEKEMILEDGIVTDKDGSVILDDSNWQEGFDWIVMEITCTKCDHETDDWLSYETM